MPLDAAGLETFYAGAQGAVVRRLIQRRLRQLWPNVAGLRVLGFGYAAPYLRPFAVEAERVLAAIPAGAASAPWSPKGKGLTALVEELALPFADASFDCLLVVHGLETSEAQRPFLRELWRVLTPEGRLMLVAPNRASLWAQLERTPFGSGQPYSRSQLNRLLEESLFCPERYECALFMPPIGKRRSIRGGRAWEGIGHALWPRLAGVHIVEASKSMYVPVPAANVARRLVLSVARP